MGLFDTLNVRCPKCDKEIELQTKAGPCAMHRYWLPRDEDSVPRSIINGFKSEVITCDTCNSNFRIEIDSDGYPEIVPLSVAYQESRKKLLDKLAECHENMDKEVAHIDADDALLAYIDDDEITAAFEKIHKWYA